MRNNFLEKAPNLKLLPSLRVLDVSTNKISNFDLIAGEQNYVNMEEMDFSNNSITFEQGREQVATFTEKLKKFGQLTKFNIEHNDFVDARFMD